MAGSTWKVCRCEHYQTQHRMPEPWELDDGRQECFVDGCRCSLYRQVWVPKSKRAIKRREMHRRLRRARTVRDRVAREKKRAS
jgi:hypothetical protein